MSATPINANNMDYLVPEGNQGRESHADAVVAEENRDRASPGLMATPDPAISTLPFSPTTDVTGWSKFGPTCPCRAPIDFCYPFCKLFHSRNLTWVEQHN